MKLFSTKRSQEKRNGDGASNKIERNIPKTYLFAFFWMFLIFLPVFIPYLLTFKITMHQVFLLQVAFGLTIVILEVPSGYLSDLWGRKRVLMVGGLFNFAGYSMLFFANSIWDFLLMEILLGVGSSMTSGTDLSMLYDSLKEKKIKRAESTKIIANFQFFSLISEGTAAILGGLIASTSYSILILAQWVAGLFPIIIASTLVEPSFQRMSDKNHKENFQKVFAFLWKERFVRLLFINLTVWGISTFVAVWIFQKYWQDGGVALIYFGFLWAFYNFVVAITSKLAPKLEQRFGSKSLICLVGLLPIVGYLGMAYSTVLWGIFFGLLFQISRGINQVILKDALNWRMPSEFRATANSIGSLMFRLGFCLLGPAVGFSIDQFDMTITLTWLAGLFTLTYFALLLPFLKEVQQSSRQKSVDALSSN